MSARGRGVRAADAMARAVAAGRPSSRTIDLTRQELRRTAEQRRRDQLDAAVAAAVAAAEQLLTTPPVAVITVGGRTVSLTPHADGRPGYACAPLEPGEADR